MTRPAGLIVIASLLAAGGLTAASPAVGLLPFPLGLRYVGQAPASREDVDKAIDALGGFDYDQRMTAARLVRRAPGMVALPALLDAAAGHTDGFVRYRALVLLSGYDDPRVPDQMEQALEEVNDRLRAVAFAYFERHPEPRLTAIFLKALDKEVTEFARPALIRALAAQGRDNRVQAALVRDVTRGQDVFRASAIRALGEYKAAYALKAISAVAGRDGPLREDAMLAVGKIGDKTSLGLFADAPTTGPQAHPTVAAAICLLGRDCQVHRGFLVKTLTSTSQTPVFPELLREAASGLSALAVDGDVEAGRALLEIGVPAVDPVRAPVALALARLAIAQPLALVGLVEERQDSDPALELLRDGFVILEDDFSEEQFFVAVRKAYFTEPEASARRPLIQSMINMLEF